MGAGVSRPVFAGRQGGASGRVVHLHSPAFGRERKGPGVQRQSELCSEFEASWAMGWGRGEISDKNLSFFELCTRLF